MKNLKNNLKLNWPESLSDITLKNLNMTELWFLRNTIDSGDRTVTTTTGEVAVRTTRFGYDECYVDIGDQRYLLKHKTWVSGEEFVRPNPNIVFYVQKHKNLIGK